MKNSPNPRFIKRVPLEEREAWANALRSGKYKQGKSYLEEDGRYCCLGVLQEMRGKPTRLPSDIAPDGLPVALPSDFFEDRNAVRLGGKLAQEWNLAKVRIPCDDYDLNPTPATLNDEGYTFEEIADLIHPEGAKDEG